MHFVTDKVNLKMIEECHVNFVRPPLYIFQRSYIFKRIFVCMCVCFYLGIRLDVT